MTTFKRNKNMYNIIPYRTTGAPLTKPMLIGVIRDKIPQIQDGRKR